MKNFTIIALLSASCSLASAAVPCIVTAVEGNLSDIDLRPGEGGASGPKNTKIYYYSGGDSEAGGGSGGPIVALKSTYRGGDGDGGGGPSPRIIYSDVLAVGGGGGPKLEFNVPITHLKGKQAIVLECDFNDEEQEY